MYLMSQISRLVLLEEAKAKLVEEARTQPDVQLFVDFLELSKRGIIR